MTVPPPSDLMFLCKDPASIQTAIRIKNSNGLRELRVKSSQKSNSPNNHLFSLSIFYYNEREKGKKIRKKKKKEMKNGN